MEKYIKGIGVSPGIVIGDAYLFVKDDITLDDYKIQDVNAEKDLLLKARKKTTLDLIDIRNKTARKFGDDKAKIFDAHITILEDDELFKEVCELIEDKLFNASYALKSAIDVYKDIFSNLDDEYMKNRIYDIEDVSLRWIYNILGKELITLSNLPKNAIVIAYDLTPSDTSSLDLDNIKGFITEIGGSTSHTSIMATSLEIPAVVGVTDIFNHIKKSDKIILDSINNTIVVNPEKSVLEEYKSKIKEYEKEKSFLKEYLDKESISKDGVKVKIYANIGSPLDMKNVLNYKAEGIGLYRTEFLFMGHDDFPSEEEQFEAYKVVAASMYGHTVTIRTMDIGADKHLSYMPMPHEENPALGFRALRICLEHTDILKTQFKALLRASMFGKIKIMLPMIVDMDEVLKVKSILNECKDYLREKNISFNEDIELGIMVETPSVVFRAEAFAHEVDFFSIGTNDLTQYTLAADRGNYKVASICDPFNPSVLNAIKMIIDGAHKGGIVVSMCGEFASDTLAIPILFGMGLDIFSMSPLYILPAKKLIISLEKSECEMLAHRVLRVYSATDVKNTCEKFLYERGLI